MKFLSNVEYPVTVGDVATLSGESAAQAVADCKRWIADNVVGEPKATEQCTVGELKAMGMVGVYSDDE